MSSSWERFASSGQLEDLEAAIEAFQQAVDSTPPDSPERAAILSNLGSGLSDRYAYSGDRADLEAARSARWLVRCQVGTEE